MIQRYVSQANLCALLTFFRSRQVPARSSKDLADPSQCVDVFAMPQSGTSVTVESVDHVFQTKMLDMLKQTGRYVPSSLFPAAPLPLAVPKWSSAGTTHIQVSAAGSQTSTSTPNNHSSN
jgi:hypothetical protein